MVKENEIQRERRQKKEESSEQNLGEWYISPLA